MKSKKYLNFMLTAPFAHPLAVAARRRKSGLGAEKGDADLLRRQNCYGNGDLWCRISANFCEIFLIFARAIRKYGVDAAPIVYDNDNEEQSIWSYAFENSL